jgi:hypothetical protein
MSFAAQRLNLHLKEITKIPAFFNTFAIEMKAPPSPLARSRGEIMPSRRLTLTLTSLLFVAPSLFAGADG